MKTRNVVLKIETRKGFKGCIAEMRCYKGVPSFLYEARSYLCDFIKQYLSNDPMSIYWFLRCDLSPFTKDLVMSGKTGKFLEDSVLKRARTKVFITKLKREWK